MPTGGYAADFPAGTQLGDFNSITEISGTAITISTPTEYKPTQGVIKGKFESTEEVKELYEAHASNPSISEVKQIGETNVYVLSFTDNTLPTDVIIFFQRFEVKPYFRHPMRCTKCQRYNHTKLNCRSTLTCGKCSKVGHDHTMCTSTVERCANCGKNHQSNNKNCPFRTFELAVQKEACNTGVTLETARNTKSFSYSQALQARQASKKRTPSRRRSPSRSIINKPTLELASTSQPTTNGPKKAQNKCNDNQMKQNNNKLYFSRETSLPITPVQPTPAPPRPPNRQTETSNNQNPDLNPLFFTGFTKICNYIRNNNNAGVIDTLMVALEAFFPLLSACGASNILSSLKTNNGSQL